MKRVSTFLLLGLCAAISWGQQNVAAADYFQPMRDFSGGKANGANTPNFAIQDVNINSNYATVTKTSDTTGSFYQLSGWKVSSSYVPMIRLASISYPPNGGYNSCVLDFQYQVTTGNPATMQFFMRTAGGSSTKAIQLQASSTTEPEQHDWSTAHVRFAYPGGSTGVTTIDFQAKSNAIGGGVVDSSVPINLRNIRVSFPRRLAGVMTQYAGNLGSVSFGSTGTTASNRWWVQNIGSTSVLNVFGDTDLGYDSGNKTLSALPMNWTADDGSQHLILERLNGTYSVVSSTVWAGPITPKDGIDRYYSINTANGNNKKALIRQTLAPDGSFSHTVRRTDAAAGWGAEVPLDLNGNQIVGVGDFNGDGIDDILTAGALSYAGQFFKLFRGQGTTGTGANLTLNLTPVDSTDPNGNLVGLAVGDVNNDGYDDVVLQDQDLGDIFVMFGYEGGTSQKMSPHWIFRLNAAANEKFLALADANGDGQSEIYTTRTNLNGNTEIDCYGLNCADQVVTGDKTNYTVCDPTVVSYNYLTEFPTNFKIVGVGDLNLDGTADLLVAGDDDPNYTLVAISVAASNFSTTNRWLANAFSPNLRPMFGS